MELKVNWNKKDDQTKQVSKKDKSQQSKNMSGSSVQPMAKTKLGQNKKDNKTKKVSDKDRSQQSKSASDSSKTNSAGTKQDSKAQVHVKDKEDSQPQHTDANLVKVDAHLEPESSKEQKNSECVTEGDAEQLTAAESGGMKGDSVMEGDTEQLTAAESGGMKDEGQSQPQEESKLTDETTQKDSEQEVIANESLMSGKEQLAVQEASSAELKTDEVKEVLNNEEELPQRSESPSPADGSTQVAELQDEENAGDVVKDRENEQTDEKIVSSEADISDSKEEPWVLSDLSEETVDGMETLGHDLTKRDKKYAEPLQTQSKPEVRTRRRRRRRSIRQRSEADSSRYLAAGEQHSSYKRQQRYDPEVHYSGHDALERYSQRDRMKRDAHDSDRWNYHYDQSGRVHYITRRADHSREEMKRYDRHSLPDLEDISSDEETVYQDGGNHCCRFCQTTFETISSLLEHLQSAAHEQVFKDFVYISKLPS